MENISYQLSLFERELLEKERNQLVVKSNSLIQKTRYSLSTQQQKILLYIISKIKPEDEAFKTYSFDLKKLCAVCGIETNGKNYQNFKDSIKALHDNSFWLETEKKDILISWLQEVEIDKAETKVRIRLDERLKPYLLKVFEDFYSFEFGSILLIKSKYSIRLYELFKSFAYKGIVNISIKDLREWLCCETKYEQYKEFNRNILQKSINEINRYTDLNISYLPIYAARKVNSITFNISVKDEAEIAILRLEREGRLYNG